MAIGDDLSIAANGDIRHDSGVTNYTVLQLHRWMSDLADDPQASGNDFMDITFATPSERSTDNIITLNAPYNIDDTLAEYLYDGSITQAGGDTVYSGLVVVGAAEAGTELQITQDHSVLTSHWATGKNADAGANILNRVLVKVRDGGADIDEGRIRVWARELGDTYAEFDVTMGLGNNTAAIFTGNDLNNNTAEGTISGWTGITNTEGYQEYDLHQDDGTTEPYYSRWDFGTNSAAEVYERTKWTQRRATATTLHGMNGQLFRGVTHQWNYDGQTTNFTENADIVWGTHMTFTGQTTNFTVGEYLTFSGGAVGKLLWADDGGATGSIVVAVEDAGSVLTTETITGITSGGDGTVGTVTDDSSVGGSAVLLADDDNGAAGTMWVQLTHGAPPSDNAPLYQVGSTAVNHGDVAGSVTSRTVSPEFIGTYTGSAFIGAFGIGVEPTDGIAADQFFDLTNTLAQPPNNQDFDVFGAVAGDYVLVTNDNATGIDFAQLTLSGTLSGGAVAAVVVSAAIPADTPSTGWVRVETDGGRYHLCAYTSWATSTFTINPTEDFSGDNATSGNNVFIGYLDKVAATDPETWTGKYTAPRTMFVRARYGGASPIKTFQSTAAYGSGGGSATVIRTSDA